MIDLRIDRNEARICTRFAERIPIHFARQHVLVGLSTEEPSVTEIATDDPKRAATIDNLGLTLNCEVRMVLAPRDDILAAIDVAYQQQRSNLNTTIEELEIRGGLELDLEDGDGDLLDNASRAPVVKLVNLILFEAARRRASDIHLQPTERDLVVRLRIDGVLVDFLTPGKQLHEELVSRIKVMGAMDIAEKRLPQDGRTTVRIGQRLIDLRISIIPTAHGERAVLRLLDKGARLYDLDSLGMAPGVLGRFEQIIHRAHGLLLLTGPTGGGKSTTLYAALQKIDYHKLNVVTLEDPIEYHLPGISQTQVAQRKGMTFATGLRSVLRQDPDVIMVGEIRDAETARLSVQSALTGHLVLSTLHTNDAPGAAARLLDLGIEPYLVADALLGVGAQRLVRLICERCKELQPIAFEHAALFDSDPPSSVWRGRGCPHCNETGYREREGIFEFMVMSESLRACIQQRAAVSTIRTAAVEGGMVTLRQDGIRKVRTGRTTPAEVLRVTQE